MEKEILTVCKEQKVILEELTEQLNELKEIKELTKSMDKSLKNLEKDVEGIKSIFSQKVQI